jgi:hypothetical protein
LSGGKRDARYNRNSEARSPADTTAYIGSVLEGAYIYQVLDWMVNDGFHQDGQIYNDGNRQSVDWTQAGILRDAISQGPVKIGVAADQLQNVWSGHSGWFATGFHADANEDHCVTLCGYGTIAWLAQRLNVQVPAGVDGTQPGYALFTWNSIGIIDLNRPGFAGGSNS